MLRVGVPSGVGDVYWALTKIKAFADGKPVKIVIQSSLYDRAVAWAEMVDFIDGAEFGVFKCGPAKLHGIQGRWKNLDAVLWPNAVIDRGERIETWLPHLPIDLNFKIKCPDYAPRVIVYPSSMGSAVWTQRGGEFWDKVITHMAKFIGPVTVVGSHWDQSMADQITAPCEKLIGMTSLPELAGMLKTARVVVGVISGVTILANHFRTPCVTIWHDQRFPAGFPRAWAAPDAPYEAFPAGNCSAGTMARSALALAR